MNLEEAVKELQEAMTIMAHLEKRQSAVLLEHSERVVDLEEQSAKHKERILALEEQSAIFQQRIDQNLSEITDKLNGLIGYVAGQQPPEQKH
jgi:hypothetical protein